MKVSSIIVIIVTLWLVQLVSGNVIDVMDNNTPSYITTEVDISTFDRLKSTENAKEYTDDLTLRETCDEAPGAVRNLTSTMSGTTVTISWIAPENSSCVTGYVAVYNNQTQSFNATVTSFNPQNLEYCIRNEFNVAAVGSTEENVGEYSSTFMDVELPTVLSVQNLEASVSNDTLRITWQPPTNAEACVSEYVVNIWDQNNSDVLYNTTNNTDYVINPVVPCITYHIEVTPYDVAGATPSSITLTVDSVPTNSPTNGSEYQISTTWANFEWSVDSYSSNMCEISEFFLECEALSSENEDKDWIIKTANVRVDVTDSFLRPPISTNITGLSEFSNYTCYGVVVNSGGASNKSDPVKFQTIEAVPSEPVFVDVQNISSKEFMISWEEPLKVPGILQYYTITIQALESLHYVQEECQIPINEIYIQTEPNNTEYMYESAAPNYFYTIKINASTRVGSGSQTSDNVTTLFATPEKPQNISQRIEIEDIFDYNVTATLSWLLPCNTNGELDHFMLVISGAPTYTTNEINTEIQENITVGRNDPIENITYEYSVSNIRGSYNYSVLILAVLNNGMEGEYEEIVFTSPEGYPGAPTITESTTTENTSFIINWVEPSIKNGQLLNYNIIIQSHGPLYIIPAGENCNTDLNSHNFTVSADTTSLDFVDALPYYNYSVSLHASTSVGYGPASDVLIVITSEAVPEKPNFINSELVEQDLENYTMLGIITWSLPCRTNGVLSHFNIEINGTSTIDSTTYFDTKTVQADLTSDDYYALNYSITNAAYSYRIAVAAVLTSEQEGETNEVEFVTPEGYPGSPVLNEALNIENTSFSIAWNEPAIKNGRLLSYNVTIEQHGPLYEIAQDSECTENTEIYTAVTDANNKTHEFKNGLPYHNYSILVRAATSVGYGAESNKIIVHTAESEPERVRNFTYNVEYIENEEYQAALSVSFQPPCHTYGILEYYELNLTGLRAGYEDHVIVQNTQNVEYYIDSLRPEYNYTVQLTVKTRNFKSSAVSENFQSAAGVPAGVTETVISPVVNGSSTAVFEFSNDLFDQRNGDIIYYAIILGTGTNSENSTFGHWDGVTWPLVGSNSRSGILRNSGGLYQATPNFWNPFAEGNISVYTFVIGSGDCYESGYCNEILQPETEYALKVRALTRNAYRDSPTVTFVTDKLSSARNALIFGITFGLVTAILLIALIVVLWRRKNRWTTKKTSIIAETNLPRPVPIKDFPAHYKDFATNYDKLKVEYTLLATKTSEINSSTSIAELPENKCKNRYTNIMPFDNTRVILASDTDDDSCSSYINASFINGFSGKLEYIATQGPLRPTCVDFWRMVLQENVTLIVMLAQFIEQNKEKCYRYFPDNHETMIIGNGIEVRCCTELNFGAYIVRTLLVQRDLEKCTVTHLQFTEWPDFGCPTGTEQMLQLCRLIRTRHAKDVGIIVVHCSAGVGRTGTLIALDILLQTINAKLDIDVFGTVLNLRKQRPNMVQTEKQYLYIHHCVNDEILTPPQEEDKRISEPIYENVGLLPEYQYSNKISSKNDVEQTPV